MERRAFSFIQFSAAEAAQAEKLRGDASRIRIRSVMRRTDGISLRHHTGGVHSVTLPDRREAGTSISR